MQESLIKIIGYNSKKKGGQQILEGTFDVPDKTSKYIAMVIDRLQISQAVKDKD